MAYYINDGQLLIRILHYNSSSFSLVCSCIILSMLAMAFVAYWIDYKKAKKKNKVASTPANDVRKRQH